MDKKKEKKKLPVIRVRERWVDGRYYPTEENPRYGQCFQICAIQIININRRYSDWEPCTIGDNELIPVGKNWKEWMKKKNEISEKLVSIFNYDGTIKVPIRDVVALKVHYLGDSKNSYQIL